MKKKISIALAAFAFALLLVVGSVAGTIAYLTSTAEVTNTFTVGNVKITMDETDVDNSTADAERDIKNTYHLLPGHTYVKDPVIHIEADSESCYLFVKVENQLENIEKTGETVKDQLGANKWKALDGVVNVYYIELANISDSDTTDPDIDVKVFEKIVISADVDNATLDDYSNKTITVTAYAVQADGFNSAAAAWTATFGAPNN